MAPNPDGAPAGSGRHLHLEAGAPPGGAAGPYADSLRGVAPEPTPVKAIFDTLKPAGELSVREETFRDALMVPERRLNWFMAACVYVSFCAPGGIVLTPRIFAILGYVFGPIVLLGFFVVLSFCMHGFVAACVVLDPPGLGELGRLLAGRQMKAWIMALQTLNVLFYMPFALSVAALSVQQLVNAAPGTVGACNGLYCVCVAAFGFIVSQTTRNFHGASYIAPAFCVLALIQTIFTAYVIVRDNPAGEQPTAPIIGMGGEAFAEFRDWISIVSALANCTYCYVTGFITVEVTGEMTKPSDCYKAIYSAAIFMYAIYLVVGTSGAYLLGPTTPPVITIALPQADPLAMTVTVIVLIGTIYGYLLSGIIVGNNFMDWMTGALSRSGINTSQRWLIWLICTLPGNLFSLLLVSVVPNVDDILGLITGLSVIVLLMTFQPLCGIHWARGSGETDSSGRKFFVRTDSAKAPADAAPTKRSWFAFMPDLYVGSAYEAGLWTTAAVGIPFSVIVLAKVVYHLTVVNFEGDSYFCDVVNGGG